MVRLAGIEPTTPWFVAKYSIQLSYSRVKREYSTYLIRYGSPPPFLNEARFGTPLELSGAANTWRRNWQPVCMKVAAKTTYDKVDWKHFLMSF
jgi:hypothetical protein